MDDDRSEAKIVYCDQDSNCQLLVLSFPDTVKFQYDFLPQTDGRTEERMQNDAYEPNVQVAQLGSKQKRFPDFPEK